MPFPPVADAMTTLRAAATSRAVFTVADAALLPAGSHQLRMCGRGQLPNCWNATSAGRTTVVVHPGG